MNEIMTREEFLKERNAVCESDAVAGGDDVCKGQDADTAVMTEENGKLSADGITVSEVVVKGRRNRQYAGLILFITAGGARCRRCCRGGVLREGNGDSA